MVPLAKQKMEDDFMATSSKMNQISAQTSSADSQQADQIINDFKSRTSGLSDDVINKGVSREQFNKLRGLRNEIQEEFSSGFLGSAISNKKAMSEYVNKMTTDKMAQAGWSPLEAQQWAMSQVGQFGKTMAEDGSFRSFQGRQLAQKVNEDEWLSTTLKGIAGEVSKSALYYAKVGGMPSLKKAFQNDKVSRKDFNKIMRTFLSKAKNSPDLLNSLKQQAFFTGEENPLDFGKFEKTLDKNENLVNSFKVGSARFGRKMVGEAYGGSYYNKEIDSRIIDDKIALMNLEAGMNEQSALQLAKAYSGKLNDISRPSYENLKKSLESATHEIESLDLERINYEKKLLSNNEDYQNLIKEQNKIGWNPEEKENLEKKASILKNNILRNNKDWVILNNDYKDASTRQSNAESYIEGVRTRALDNLRPEVRKYYQMNNTLMEDIPEWNSPEFTKVELLESAIRNIQNQDRYEGEVVFKDDKSWNDIGIGVEDSENFLLAKYLELKGNKKFKRTKKNENQFVDVGGVTEELLYNRDELDAFKKSNKIIENSIDGVLEANPKAESFKVLISEDLEGKRAPLVTRANNLLKKTWENQSFLDNAQLAYTGEKLTIETIEDMIGSSLNEGYEFTPYITDSWDSNGQKFINVNVRNKESGEYTTIQVIDNSNKQADLAAANQLLRSNNPEQQSLGQRIIDGYKYMKNVKLSSMHNKEEGRIRVPGLEYDDGTQIDVNWTKDPKERFWRSFVGGQPINNGNGIYGENDMVEAISEYVEKLKSQDND